MERVEILGVKVDRVTRHQALKRIAEYIICRKPHLVATANTEMIMRSAMDGLLSEILLRADLVVPDGIGVVWASRLKGQPVPERVPGVELTELLLAESARQGWKVFFLGGQPGVAVEAADRMRQRYPGLNIVGCRDGYFTKEEEGEVLTAIKNSEPDILLVALGMPKQEKWAAAHIAELKVPVAIGVGGTLDIFAGRTVRAPQWMQRLGLEWLYRLLADPKRIRRMSALPQFVLLVLLETLLGKEG